MRINDIGCKARILAIAATISIGLCFVSPASAQEDHLFILDLKNRGAIDLGGLGNKDYLAKAGINDAGQVFASFLDSDFTPHAFITGPNGKGRTDLGTLGGKGSEALDINASGQIVGWSNTSAGDAHAFITRPNGGGMTDLGTLGGKESRAYGINDAGRVVGSSTTAEGVDYHAFITGSDGVGMKDLGTLGGATAKRLTLTHPVRLWGITGRIVVPILENTVLIIIVLSRVQMGKASRLMMDTISSVKLLGLTTWDR